MNALNKRITIQDKAITQDNELNAIETWQDFATVWAAALPQSGREFYRLRNNNSEITEVFKIRYLAGVTAHMRVVFNSASFEIISVIKPEERGIEMILSCKAVV